jgi:hypothetical protein
MTAGAISLYFFVSRSMFHGQGMFGKDFDPALPFRAMGKADYPTNALLLLGAAWGFILGLWFVLIGDEGSSKVRRGGAVARLLLLNGLLLVSTLFAGFVGGRSGADPLTVGIFAALAAVQTLLGLLLLVLALFERPKGVLSLLLGTAVWLAGATIGALTFLWGGPT